MKFLWHHLFFATLSTFLAYSSAASILHPSTSAQGKIYLSGEVPVFLDLTVVDTNQGIDFDQLGSIAIHDKKIGHFIIDSNAQEGFRLKISSLQNGWLVRQAGKSDQHQRIPYSLSLNRRGGVLGSRQEQTHSMQNLELSQSIELDFSGVQSGPTSKLNYDVGLSFGKKRLQPGLYSDTITIQLLAL